MFRQLAALLTGLPTPPPSTVPLSEQQADLLFNRHPAELVALLEAAWNDRSRTSAALGRPDNRSALDGLDGSIGQVIQPRTAVGWGGP